MYALRLATAAFLVLAACAGPVLDLRGVDASATASEVAARPDEYKGRTVQWGGVIVSVRNLTDSTRVELLSYPLDRSGRPRTGEPPLGRFLADRAGYLETAVFTPGRLLTVVGKVTGTRTGKIGEADYTYPAVAAEQLHLWPLGSESAQPRVQFGIGVIF